MMKSIQEFYPLLSQPARVVITMHQKPDADAMGSSLALAHFLKGLGHQVHVISPTNWARWLNWMPGTNEVIDFESERLRAEELLDTTEWLFCLDFNVFLRTRYMAEKLRQINCVKVLIDHHQEPDAASFNYGVSDTGKSSTCEMIFDFINGAGYRDHITRDIAECIYAGVVADTGSFRFSSTSASVHSLVADLKTRGLDHVKVHEALFDNFLENKLRFTGHVLLNRLDFLYEYNTALIAIPKFDLLKFQIKPGRPRVWLICRNRCRILNWWAWSLIGMKKGNGVFGAREISIVIPSPVNILMAAAIFMPPVAEAWIHWMKPSGNSGRH